MKVLAGDLGGTKTVLGVVATGGTALKILTDQTYSSPAFACFDEIVAGFLANCNIECEYACFGVPGAIQGSQCSATNLPWVVDADTLASKFGFTHAWLVNDLEAHAWGIECLQESDLYTVNIGKPHGKANQAVIAAGTGLGEAGLLWDGQYYRPFATEGGHSSFSPTSDLEIELLRCLRKKYGHVSWERVVSGMGIVDIYGFLVDYHQADPPQWLTKERLQKDAAGCISDAALAGNCQICMQALDIFIHLYGVETGNLALKVMAQGGVYVGGGIALRILDKFKEPTFFKAFSSKGRMTPLLNDIPVKVILEPNTGLYGSARFIANQPESLVERC